MVESRYIFVFVARILFFHMLAYSTVVVLVVYTEVPNMGCTKHDTRRTESSAFLDPRISGGRMHEDIVFS